MSKQAKTSSGKIVTIVPKREKVNRSTQEKIIIWTIFVFLVIYAVTLIFPFFYILVNSARDTLIYWGEPLGLPTSFKPLIKNYSYVFTEMEVNGVGLPFMFLNSIILSVSQTFIALALSCITAYVLAKYKFKGNAFIYTFTIVASVAPTIGATPATYKLMAVTFGFVGSNYAYNLLGMLFMIGAFGGPFLYLHSFFKAIPWSYGESAQLDGASDFRIFVQIMIPLAINGVLTFTIMRFLGFWNEYWGNYLYFQEYPTLAVGVAILSKKPGQDTQKFAAMIVSIIPILTVYAFTQKQLMKNTVGGGLKG